MMGIPVTDIMNLARAKQEHGKQGGGRSTMFGLPALSRSETKQLEEHEEEEESSHTQRYMGPSVGITSPSGFPSLTRDAVSQALIEESSEVSDDTSGVHSTQVMGSFADIQKLKHIKPPSSSSAPDSFTHSTSTGSRPFTALDPNDQEQPEGGSMMEHSIDDASPHGTLMGMSISDIHAYEEANKEVSPEEPEPEPESRSTMFSFPSPFQDDDAQPDDYQFDDLLDDEPAIPSVREPSEVSEVESADSSGFKSPGMSQLDDVLSQNPRPEDESSSRSTMFGLPAMTGPSEASDTSEPAREAFDSSYSITSDSMEEGLASTSILASSKSKFEEEDALAELPSESLEPAALTPEPAQESQQFAGTQPGRTPAPLEPAHTPLPDVSSVDPAEIDETDVEPPTPRTAQPSTPRQPTTAPPMPASTGARTSGLSPMEKLGQVDMSVEPDDPGMSVAHRGITVAAGSMFVVSSVTGFVFTAGGGVITSLILVVPLLLAAISAGALFVPRSLRRWMLGVVAAIGIFIAVLAMIQTVALMSTFFAVMAVGLVLVSIALSLL